MKWVWRTALAVVAVILVLGAIVVGRTLTMASPATTAQAASVDLAPAPQIDAQRAAARLGEAIRFQTVSRTEGVVENPQAFTDLHAFLARTYPLTHAEFMLTPVAEYSLLYTLQGTDPSLPPLLLLAHQDVVPVEAGTEGDWEAPPFSGEIKDGYVYGRGATDDKGSLIAIMEGTEALLAQGFRPRRTVMLAFGHDEEVLGSGATAIAELLRTQNVRPWFVLDEGMATIMDAPAVNAPVALIGIAEKGYMSVRVTARAAGGHSSTPPAVTAADKLAQAIEAIRGRPFPGGVNDGPAASLLEALAPRMGFVQRMAIANRWLLGGVVEQQFGASESGNALLRTTIAPTMIGGGAKENVLPQEMHAIVNLRLHPRDTTDSALAYLRESVAGIEGVTIEFEGTPNNPSPVSSTQSDSYALIAAAAAAHAPEGAPVAPMLVLGATDSRHFTGIAENVYRFAPLQAYASELTRVHGTGERMSIENLERMAQFYAQIIATGAK